MFMTQNNLYDDVQDMLQEHSKKMPTGLESDLRECDQALRVLQKHRDIRDRLKSAVGQDIAYMYDAHVKEVLKNLL